MNKYNFLHADAWILLCIPQNPPGSTKEEILNSADYINHAIPTDDEFSGAISRCTNAGLIESKNDRYYLSSKYGKEINTLTENQKDILKAWDALEQFLKNFAA